MNAAVVCCLTVINTTIPHFPLENVAPYASVSDRTAPDIYVWLVLAMTCLLEETTTHLLCYQQTAHNTLDNDTFHSEPRWSGFTGDFGSRDVCLSVCGTFCLCFLFKAVTGFGIFHRTFEVMVGARSLFF